MKFGLKYFDDIEEEESIESKDEDDRDGEEKDGRALSVHPALLVFIVNSIQNVGENHDCRKQPANKIQGLGVPFLIQESVD